MPLNAPDSTGLCLEIRYLNFEILHLLLFQVLRLVYGHEYVVFPQYIRSFLNIL